MLNPMRACGVAAAIFALGACSSDGKSPGPAPTTGGDGRVTIDSDSDSLSDHVATKDEPVPVQPAGASNMLVVAPDLMYQLTLVAEVDPAQIDGEQLQATSVAFQDSKAVVSYNTAGDSQQGAVDVFMVDAQKKLTLTSRATFADTDVNAVGSQGNRVYLATSTADESFGTPAVLEGLSVSADGALTLDGHVRVGLSSFAATSVGFADGRVFATSGNAGGVWAFDPSSGAIAQHSDLADARWVTSGEDGTIVAVAGTPGRLEVLGDKELDTVDSYGFDGAQVAESKSTVEVLGGKAFIAGGPGGTIVMDLATGHVIATIPVPMGLPFAPAEMVTNAVSVDGDLVFISNGSAGVFLATASDDLSKPFDPAHPPTFSVAGRLVFPGEIASVNHIAYKDGMLFVATGRGGLKVVRVEHVVVPVEAPTGYPYSSSFDVHGLRAGWTFGGTWGWGSPDGARVGHGGAFIDNDPTEEPQGAASDSSATLDTALAIPADGAPMMSFWYGLDFIDDGDRVELQIDDGSGFATVATFTHDQERSDVTRFVMPLDDYAGKTIHVRFHQAMGAPSGVRRFTIDDFSVAESDFATLAYPYETSFESELDRSAWTLAGDWGFAAGDAYDGAQVLGTGRAVSAENGQSAEMVGWIPVPASGTPVVGFWYRTALGADDGVEVEAQVQGETAWQPLASFGHPATHDGWAHAEAALTGFQGKSIRIRVSSDFPGTGVHAFAVDSLRVGPLSGPAVGFPSTSDFEGGASEWATSGMLALGTRSGGDTAVIADAAGGPGADGSVELLGFVQVPAQGPAMIQFKARFGLVDAADRIVLEAQDQADAAWSPLASWGGAEAHDAWTRYEVPLDAMAGKSIRVRFHISYGGTVGGRHVAIDDVSIGGMPEGRYAWPHSLDANDLSRWSITGAWTIDASAVLDANPDGIPQSGQGEGHVATMDGFVQIPATGRPTMFANIDLDLTDSDDAVELEIQTADSTEWKTLRTYTSKVNRDDFGWDEVPLGDFAGKSVRVRFCYHYGASSEPRTLELAGLRFEDLSVGGFAFPWSNGFEGTQGSQWNLWGAWRSTAQHGGAMPAGGQGFLDGNPHAAVQQDYTDLQTATLGGDIMIPADSPSWLTLKHHFGAIDAADSLQLQIQTPDSASWTTLATLGVQHARDGYSTLELGLDAYRGKAVRLRLAMQLGDATVVRDIRIDDVRIGEMNIPTVPAPLVVSTFGPASNIPWDLHGSWDNSTGAIDANPHGIDMGGFDGLHTATLGEYVDISQVPGAQLAVTYKLGLTDAADRAYIEVQPVGSAQWFTVQTWKLADNATQNTTLYSLSAWNRPVRVRARIAPSAAHGVRTFEIVQMVVGVPSGN